jgi:hypothetical protein
MACPAPPVPPALDPHRIIVDQPGRWFGFLTDQMLRCGVHKSVQALERDVRTWIEAWNQDPRPFIWKKTAEEILYSLAKYICANSGGGH